MTNENNTTVSSIDTPIVCTLTPDEVPDQLAGWADLQHRAKDIAAIESGVRMTLPASMVDQVADLIRREAACCEFLNFGVAVRDGIMTLEITTPNLDALPVISALAGISADAL